MTRGAGSDRAALRLCVYTRAWRSGGAGLFAQQLVEGLVGEGAEVTYVCPRVDDARLETPRAGLRRIRPPRERGGDAPAALRAAVSLARIAGGALGLARARWRNRVFVVSIPDPLGPAVAMLALLRLSGARILFVAHDPLPHGWALPRALRGLEIALHGACYRLASAVVVLSEASRVRLAGAFPRLRTPVTVIEHGVFVMGDPVSLPGDGCLLAFGTIRRNKGTLEAIEGVAAAAAGGAAVRLVVAGGAHRDDRTYADACAAAAAASPAVEMRLGYVDDDALLALIARTDALVMPYGDFHSQSGVAILAASNARPVIATRAGGIATLIDEGMPAVVIEPPADAGAVADAVRRFAATPPGEWRARAARYRETMLATRSWPVIARQYIALARRY